MEYKKLNEAWFGDVFNRDATVTACASSINELSGICKGATVMANCALNADIAFKSDTHSLYDEIQSIQARINELEHKLQPKKGADKLRSALKTLNYTREL